MIWSVLEEAVHDVVALWANCFVENGRDCDIHEWVQAHSFGFCLLKCYFKLLHSLTVNMYCTLQ